MLYDAADVAQARDTTWAGVLNIGTALQIEFNISQLQKRAEELRRRKEQLERQASNQQRVPSADWARESFPWSQQLSEKLRDVFGLKAYRYGR
jgi:hypothetical protein